MKKVMLALFSLALATLACQMANDAPAGEAGPTATATTMAGGIVSESLVAMPTAAVSISCIVTGDLNLRAGPGIDYQVRGWLYAGQEVRVDANPYGDWRLVTGRGYAHGDWLDCGGQP